MHWLRSSSGMKILATLALAGSAILAIDVAPAVAGTVSPLTKGAEIPIRGCTYGTGETHNGRESGQYLVDRNAFYAIVVVPTDLQGGHFRFRGTYPRARWFSFESYDRDLASQGVVADSEINADAGSINPFFAGNSWKLNQHYTVDVRMTPPSERQDPHPNVLYSGYRENPKYGNVETSAVDGLLYRVYAAPGTPEGNVPLPTVSWVVDNPETNPFEGEAEVCAAVRAAGADQDGILTLNQILAERFSNPTLSPDEQGVNVPTNEVPRNPPYVDVIRPATNGYQGAFFNSKTPYIFFRPNGELYGNFIVVHFKAPTFSAFPAKPITGNEQVRYWSWCDDQFVSPVNITVGCLRDNQFKLEPGGYATLVVSEPSQRPTIKGKPWSNWLPWPGGGADVVMRQIDPNPATFLQSPYFYPVMNEDDGLDYLLGVLFEAQMKEWMGEYFPSVRFCNKATFERHECFS